MLQLFLILFCLFSLFADEKITTHSIQLEQETLNYTATVSSGGDVGYIAYVKQTTENRPITFAFNGGPGASSVWLHLAALGPRRLQLPEEGAKPTPPHKMIDNLETILDLTDLVFIDPSGTGLSKSDKERHSIKADIESVGKFIRDYLTQNKRWNSPKYLAGESYGAVRAAGVADYLQNEFAIYLNGILFVSAAIDYQVFWFDADNQLPYFLFFPTYATTAWYHGKYRSEASLEEVAKEAREFAYSIYAPALICPKRHAIHSLYKQLSERTGLALDIVESHQGRINESVFGEGLLRDERKIVGRFDSRITGHKDCCTFLDPSLTNIEGPIAASLHDYLHKELDLQNSYTLFSGDASKEWDHHNYNKWGYPNLMSALRRSLFNNPSMKLFVGCGYFDLATPFATVEYCIDHLDVPEIEVQMEYYEGGHMFYLNPTARGKFKQDLIRFYKESI